MRRLIVLSEERIEVVICMRSVSLDSMKKICYFYGVYNLILQSLQLARESQRPKFFVMSLGALVSLIIFTFIMLRFKEELNIRLHSVKMDRVINLMIFISIFGYVAMLLSRLSPGNVVIIQLIIGIGDLVLSLVYAVLLKSLDAPIELTERIKDLPLYSNCIIIAVIMAITLIGIVLSIFLVSLSYFILGNIFMEMKEIEVKE